MDFSSSARAAEGEILTITYRSKAVLLLWFHSVTCYVYEYDLQQYGQLNNICPLCFLFRFFVI